jgi:RNA polymerase-binding protein DksA
MANTGSRSLADRATSVARRVVARRGSSAASGDAPAKTAAKKSAKTSAANKSGAKKATPDTKATASTKKATPSKKNAAKKASPTKTAASAKSVTPTKKNAARKAPAAKPTAKKTSSVKKVAAKQSAPATKAAPVRKASPKKAVAKKASAEVAPAPAKVTTARKGTPGALVVLAGEKPWTKDELAEVRGHLRDDVKRLTAELKVADGDLHDLMRDAGDGAGNDQADVGSSTFERDQEMTIVNNARDMLLQSQHAIERIADGSYGVCENCGEPIGKMRLMAFPRATLCMSCKQREERR